jgi:hypothetical protein
MNDNNKTFEYVDKFGVSFYTIKSLAKAKFSLIDNVRNEEIKRFKSVDNSDIIDGVNKSIETLEKFKNVIKNG